MNGLDTRPSVPRGKALFYTALLALAAFGAYLGQQGFVRYREAAVERQSQAARRHAWQALQESLQGEIGRFKGEAGVVVKDLETGWEFSHERAKPFASASLTKIPLMAACFLAADQGRIKLDRNLALKASDKLTGSGVVKDLPDGTTFSVSRLIGLMIHESDNTATNMLTNLVGMDFVNGAFESFGLTRTRLSRKIADYHARDRRGIENYTTAEEMALILEKMYRKELVNPTVSNQCIGTLKLTRTNDRIPRYLPPELAIAHKTGLENGICHDAGIVYTRQGDFIVVVLTRHRNPDSLPSKELIATIASLAHAYVAAVKN